MGGGVLLASSGQWAGKLPNILPCAEQYCITKNYSAPNNNSVKVEKLCYRRNFEHARIQKILYTCAPEEFICRQTLANQKNYLENIGRRSHSEHLVYLIVEVKLIQGGYMCE